MKAYSFLSDTEPTDQQLDILMHEVARDAKIRAQKTNKKFFKELNLLVQLVMKQYSDNKGQKK